nr:zinc-type alcohol dehydrogenase-like protein [Tanacetum cinerariifolium]
MRLMVHLSGGQGMEPGGWRWPGEDKAAFINEDVFIKGAQLAEQAKLDAYFITDFPGVTTDLSNTAPSSSLDPVVLMALMAQATDRIGLMTTLSTTINEPYTIARTLRSLDLISKGRLGWNMVKTGDPRALLNYFAGTPNRDQKQARSLEVWEAVLRLWGSWPAGALKLDVEAGLFADASRIQPINFQGQYVTTRGPLNLPPSPQGQPVVITAGGGEYGFEFAATRADGMLNNAPTLAYAVAFWKELAAQLQQAGRNPDQFTIFNGIGVSIASTEREALQRRVRLDELSRSGSRQQYLGQLLGIPVGNLNPDAPIPASLLQQARPSRQDHRSQYAYELALKGFTIREVLAHGPINYSPIFLGTPEQVADQFQQWWCPCCRSAGCCARSTRALRCASTWACLIKTAFPKALPAPWLLAIANPTPNPPFFSIMQDTLSPPRVLIVGAGAMGLVAGYHLQLAGAEITYLVRPGRLEALARPQVLYCYDDATLRSFSGYSVVTQPGEQPDAYAYVLLTLDGASLHAAEGTALLHQLGDTLRDTSAVVISGGVGYDLRTYLVTTLGLPDERVVSGALNTLAYQVARASLPLHPPTNADDLAKADIAYRHTNAFGFTIEDRYPAIAWHFAALYDRCGVSKCHIMASEALEVLALTIFPIWAGSELMGWPRAAELSQDQETWALTIAAAREIASLKLGDNVEEAALTNGEKVIAFLAEYEQDTLPLDLHAFNAFHHGGKVAVQDLHEEPTPTLGRHDVLVKVRAASLNYRDQAILDGQYGGATKRNGVPLSDGAGEVVAVGDKVTRAKVGDRVSAGCHPHWIGGPPRPEYQLESLGMTTDGWLADYLAVHENGVVQLPAYMSYLEAASLPCAAVTAWTALNLASPLQPGQTVLVQGTGGVALFSLQVARLFGARVFAITSTDEKAERLKQLGAAAVVNYRTFPDWEKEIRALTDGRGVDKVVDIAGDKTIVKSAAATRNGGDITIVGFTSGFGGGLPPIDILSNFLTINGTAIGPRENYEALLTAMALHEVKPVIDQFGQHGAGAGDDLPWHQVPAAELIKRAVDIATGTVGVILMGKQAEKILQKGQADLAFTFARHQLLVGAQAVGGGRFICRKGRLSKNGLISTRGAGEGRGGWEQPGARRLAACPLLLPKPVVVVFTPGNHFQNHGLQGIAVRGGRVFHGGGRRVVYPPHHQLVLLQGFEFRGQDFGGNALHAPLNVAEAAVALVNGHQNGQLPLPVDHIEGILEVAYLLRNGGFVRLYSWHPLAGATGVQGGGVVEALLAKGDFTIRAIVLETTSKEAQALAAKNVELFETTFDDVEGLTKAAQGATGVFSVQVASDKKGQETQHARNLVAAAQAAGVQQFVHTAVARAGEHESFVDWDKGRWEPAYWEEKAAAMEAVKAAGFPYWTILKPSLMMQNLLPPRDAFMFPTLAQGKLIAPLAPDTKVDWVSGQDVGRFAAEAFAQPEKFNHQELSLVGDKLTLAEVAETLSAVTGKHFEAQSVSLEEALALGFHEGVAMSYVWMDAEGYQVDPQQAAGYGVEPVSLKTFLESRKALLQEAYAGAKGDPWLLNRRWLAAAATRSQISAFLRPRRPELVQGGARGLARGHDLHHRRGVVLADDDAQVLLGSNRHFPRLVDGGAPGQLRHPRADEGALGVVFLRLLDGIVHPHHRLKLRNSFLFGEGQRGTGHVLALGFGPRHTGAHALADERALKLGQRGHDVENQLARGRGGVDVFLVGDEVHAQALEFLQRVDQRLGAAAASRGPGLCRGWRRGRRGRRVWTGISHHPRAAALPDRTGQSARSRHPPALPFDRSRPHLFDVVSRRGEPPGPSAAGGRAAADGLSARGLGQPAATRSGGLRGHAAGNGGDPLGRLRRAPANAQRPFRHRTSAPGVSQVGAAGCGLARTVVGRAGPGARRRPGAAGHDVPEAAPGPHRPPRHRYAGAPGGRHQRPGHAGNLPAAGSLAHGRSASAAGCAAAARSRKEHDPPPLAGAAGYETPGAAGPQPLESEPGAPAGRQALPRARGVCARELPDADRRGAEHGRCFLGTEPGQGPPGPRPVPAAGRRGQGYGPAHAGPGRGHRARRGPDPGRAGAPAHLRPGAARRPGAGLGGRANHALPDPPLAPELPGQALPALQAVYAPAAGATGVSAGLCRRRLWGRPAAGQRVAGGPAAQAARAGPDRLPKTNLAQVRAGRCAQRRAAAAGLRAGRAGHPAREAALGRRVRGPVAPLRRPEQLPHPPGRMGASAARAVRPVGLAARDHGPPHRARAGTGRLAGADENAARGRRRGAPGSRRVGGHAVRRAGGARRRAGLAAGNRPPSANRGPDRHSGRSQCLAGLYGAPVRAGARPARRRARHAAAGDAAGHGLGWPPTGAMAPFPRPMASAALQNPGPGLDVSRPAVHGHGQPGLHPAALGRTAAAGRLHQIRPGHGLALPQQVAGLPPPKPPHLRLAGLRSAHQDPFHPALPAKPAPAPAHPRPTQQGRRAARIAGLALVWQRRRYPPQAAGGADRGGPVPDAAHQLRAALEHHLHAGSPPAAAGRGLPGRRGALPVPLAQPLRAHQPTRQILLYQPRPLGPATPPSTPPSRRPNGLAMSKSYSNVRGHSGSGMRSMYAISWSDSGLLASVLTTEFMSSVNSVSVERICLTKAWSLIPRSSRAEFKGNRELLWLLSDNVEAHALKRAADFVQLVGNRQVSVLVDLLNSNVEDEFLQIGNLHVLLGLLTGRVFQAEHVLELIQRVRFRRTNVFPLRSQLVDTLGILAGQAKHRLQAVAGEVVFQVDEVGAKLLGYFQFDSSLTFEVLRRSQHGDLEPGLPILNVIAAAHQFLNGRPQPMVVPLAPAATAAVGTATAVEVAGKLVAIAQVEEGSQTKEIWAN